MTLRFTVKPVLAEQQVYSGAVKGDGGLPARDLRRAAAAEVAAAVRMMSTRPSPAPVTCSWQHCNGIVHW